MSAFRSLRQISRHTPALGRRGYADVADGKLKLSLVLPHQVGLGSWLSGEGKTRKARRGYGWIARKML